MAFDVVFKRYFAGVVLALIALMAYLQSSGVMQLAGATVATDASALAALPPPSPALALVGQPRDEHVTSLRSVIDSNPFDSVTPRPLDAVDAGDEGGEGEPAAAVDLDHTENAPACDGLKATMILASPTDPAWSMAFISGGGGPSTKLARIFDDVGGKTVRIIEWNRVVLVAGSQVCQLAMFRNPKAVASAAQAAAPAPPPPAAGGAPGVDAELQKGIKKVGGTEFNVDRSVVDKILENQAELMKMARIVPEQENGKIVGIRLFGVRPDTLLGVLGMENGDRLQSINGFDMTSPEKALEAYARLRTADHLTVQVNRRGSNVNLDFNIK